MLSTCQEDSGQPGGCGRNCLGNCCLPGDAQNRILICIIPPRFCLFLAVELFTVSKLPLYAFGSDASPKVSPPGVDEPPSDFFLNTLLQGQVLPSYAS